ncbi:MAG: D-tyrosyl-tRNA(Tyr) deacylase [Chloroflexi bacterium]|nr:D-tyrosyl-tRNA(Tyr) deacylase [Chloroflexota bacterium]
MKFLIQKVSSAQVYVDQKIIGKINNGLCIFVGYSLTDTSDDIEYLVDKLLKMRIFPDESKKKYFEKSIQEIDGKILLISQFTLYADNKKGRRPSFSLAAKADNAKKLYQSTVNLLKSKNISVETGRFQAMMEVKIVNVGPTTILIDSEKKN